MSIKTDKISSQMEKEISRIIQMEVKDLRNNMVTVTDVKVTSDLGQAKVYYTCLREEDAEEVQHKLDHAKGYIRTELTNYIKVRHMPNLIFVYDESIAYGNKIEDIIKDLHKEETE